MPSWANILKRIEARDASKAPPHVHALDLYAIELLEAADGHMRFVWQVDQKFMNPHAVFGGYLATLADQTCSFALMTVLEDEEDFTTATLNTAFVRPVTGGRMTGEGLVLHRGRSQALVEATFSVDGKLVLKAQALERIFKAPPPKDGTPR